MSYLYDKLKEALGGSRLTDSKNIIISDWSPNSVRALFIGRDSIIVVNHLGVFGGCTKKLDLDQTLLVRDLEEINRTNYGKPKLNPLLTKRSFSCLEEIYVDTLYISMPRVINLTDYVEGLLKNSTSRLRYFGYGNLSNPELRDYLNKVYREAYTKKNYGYSFAKDTNKPIEITCRYSNNEDWYKKYYLRPQYYKKDSQGGDLDVHFRKIANGYPEYLKRLKGAELSLERQKMVEFLAIRDMKNRFYFDKIDRLLTYVSKSSDKICKLVYSSMKEVLSKDRVVEGLNKKMVSSLVDHYTELCYQRYKVYDKVPEHTLDVEKCLKSADGFIPMGAILDELCLSVTDAVLKEGYKDLVAIAMVSNLNIPNGNFSAKYLNKMERSKGETSYKGYIDYIEEIIGAEV